MKQGFEAFTAICQSNPKWVMAVTPAPGAEDGIGLHSGIPSFVQDGVRFSIIDAPGDSVIEAMRSMTSFGYSGITPETRRRNLVVIPSDKGDSVLSLGDYVFFNLVADLIYIYEGLGYTDEVKRLEAQRDKRYAELEEEERREAEQQEGEW